MATKAKVRGLDEVLRLTTKDFQPIGSSCIGIRVKIVPGRELAKYRRCGPWSSTVLENGQVLALTLVEAGLDSDHEKTSRKLMKPLGVYGTDEAEDLDWCDDARKLRGLLASFLESLPGMTWLALDVGGNGTGVFTLEYGEARLTMAIGRDPYA